MLSATWAVCRDSTLQLRLTANSQAGAPSLWRAVIQDMAVHLQGCPLPKQCQQSGHVLFTPYTSNNIKHLHQGFLQRAIEWYLNRSPWLYWFVPIILWAIKLPNMLKCGMRIGKMLDYRGTHLWIRVEEGESLGTTPFLWQTLLWFNYNWQSYDLCYLWAKKKITVKGKVLFITAPLASCNISLLLSWASTEIINHLVQSWSMGNAAWGRDLRRVGIKHTKLFQGNSVVAISFRKAFGIFFFF